MKLSTLCHGQRFKINRTSETGLLLGICGDRRRRVVVMDKSPRLTNYNAQLEVELVKAAR